MLHTSWMLYTEFKFGWTPRDNGLSLFVVGLMAVLVQGGLMRQLQRVIPVSKLCDCGLMSSTVAFFAYGAVPVGWMMYAVIVAICSVMWSTQPFRAWFPIRSNQPVRGGHGAMSSISSVAAILGPLVGAPVLATVSQFTLTATGVWGPFYLCAASCKPFTAFVGISISIDGKLPWLDLSELIPPCMTRSSSSTSALR